MQDLFSKPTVYPYGGSIKESFKEYFDSAFVAFLPFFHIDSHQKTENFSHSGIISFEQAQEEIPELKNISKPNATIYASNTDYPDDEIIYKNANIVTWAEVLRGSGIENYSDLNKALRTSIGALRPIFQRHDLTEKLNGYTTKEHIWHPNEGCYDIISKARIYKTLKLLQKNEIVLIDEHFHESITLEIEEMNEKKFCDACDFTIFYIYPTDKEILFTLDWDSFFFLIATNSENMEKIMAANLFDGFLCNDKTTHDWDYKEGEIEMYLKLEERNNNGK